MPDDRSGAIRVEGLHDLQRDLKAMEPSVRREVTAALKESAGIVARASGPLAAKRTGTLAGSFRPGASMMQGYVRSRVPYAGVQEFGGTIKPKGAPVVIEAHPAATRALRDNEERVVDKVGDAIDAVARRHGW